MSLRLFASYHLAALVLAGVAVVATPASAGGLQLIAPQPVQYHSGSCGGCGSYYVAPQPRYYYGSCGGCGYTAPHPTYYSGSCGGCGSTYAVPQPIVQPQYDDDDGYVTRRHYHRHVGYRHHPHYSHHRYHMSRY